MATEVTGILRRVDMGVSMLTLERDDGREEEWEFETTASAVDYVVMTGRPVRCLMEDGRVKEVLLASTT